MLEEWQTIQVEFASFPNSLPYRYGENVAY
jgi:hypothetical protein